MSNSTMKKVTIFTGATGLALSLQGCKDFTACADNNDCETGHCEIDELYTVVQWDNLTPGSCTGNEIVKDCAKTGDCNENYRCYLGPDGQTAGQCISTDGDACQSEADCDRIGANQYCDIRLEDSVCKSLEVCEESSECDLVDLPYASDNECADGFCTLLPTPETCLTSAQCNLDGAEVQDYVQYCDTTEFKCAKLPGCTANEQCADEFLSGTCDNDNDNKICLLKTCTKHSDCSPDGNQRTSVCDGSVCTAPKSCSSESDCSGRVLTGQCLNDEYCVIKTSGCNSNAECNTGDKADEFSSFCNTQDSPPFSFCTEDRSCSDDIDCNQSSLGFLSGQCTNGLCTLALCTNESDCNYGEKDESTYQKECSANGVCRYKTDGVAKSTSAAASNDNSAQSSTTKQASIPPAKSTDKSAVSESASTSTAAAESEDNSEEVNPASTSIADA